MITIKLPSPIKSLEVQKEKKREMTIIPLNYFALKDNENEAQ